MNQLQSSLRVLINITHGELEISAASERHSIVSQKLLSQVGGLAIKSATGVHARDSQVGNPGVLDPSILLGGESHPLINYLLFWDVQENGIGRGERAASRFWWFQW